MNAPSSSSTTTTVAAAAAAAVLVTVAADQKIKKPRRIKVIYFIFHKLNLLFENSLGLFILYLSSILSKEILIIFLAFWVNFLSLSILPPPSLSILHHRPP